MSVSKFRLWDGRYMCEVIWLDFSRQQAAVLWQLGDIQLKKIVKLTDKGVYLEQFTGIHDVDNHEVFEGDIVTTNYRAQNGDPIFGIVVFEPSLGLFALRNEQAGIWEPAHLATKQHFVGNVHENLDVMEAANERK